MYEQLYKTIAAVCLHVCMYVCELSFPLLTENATHPNMWKMSDFAFWFTVYL